MSDPAEDQMRQQMFKTMVALERMADAVTDFLGRSGQKWPAAGSMNVSEESDEDDEALRQLRMKVAGGGKCEHLHTQTQCKVCAQWIERTAEVERRPPAPTEDELKQIGGVVAKHHQVLGLLATFGELKDGGVLNTPPRSKIISLLGMRACSDCVGTGWIARDETCASCGRTGYIKA
jgi:hypothetical protein